MTARALPRIRNGGVIERAQVPLLPPAHFRDTVLQALERGRRAVAYFAHEAGPTLELLAVLANDRDATLSLVGATLDEAARAGGLRALTPYAPALHLFEREVAEQYGVEPIGHPWLKPARFQEPLGAGGPFRFGRAAGEPPQAGVTDLYRVDGEGVHEVAVGPIHAGIIEPGHFRFQCHGEEVLNLEVSLGYQHRGVERALIGGPDKRSRHLAETLAGDTTIGHTLAYARAIEALGGLAVPLRAQVLRAVALELERLANHTGDLGALANDVGFLPTASFCGRIRGELLNLTAELCGSRFGRAFVRPGGVTFDVDAERVGRVRERLAQAGRDVEGAVKLLWESPSVMARLQDTGRVSRESCDLLGLVGPVARACGSERDVRKDFPFDFYRFSLVPSATWHTGDVFSRAYVRWLELTHSLTFIAEELAALPRGAVSAGGPAAPALAPGSLTVSLVEGWRGEICHVALTDAAGRFARYKVVDPSFHNWAGVALAVRGEQISDFPLCNKSFNLSYCGHDL